MISHSETITKLMGAMLKVQGAVDGVKKTGMNPHFKKPYATLESVVDTIRPECQANGIVVMQAPGLFSEGTISVETFIVHSASGEWIKSEVSLPVVASDPQKAGSALTYAERYSLMALFNLPPVDDDGNEASERSNGSTRPPPKQSPAQLPDDQIPTIDRLTRALKNLSSPVALERFVKQESTQRAMRELTEDEHVLFFDATEAKKAELSNPLGGG